MWRRRSRGDRHDSRREVTAIAAALVLAVVLGAGAWIAVQLVAVLDDHAKQTNYLSSVVSQLDGLLTKAGEADADHRAFLQNPDDRKLKSMNESLAGIQTAFAELLKLTTNDPGVQVDLISAKNVVDKKLESIRDALDYQRVGQGSQALTVIRESGSIGSTVTTAISPIHKKFVAMLDENRNKPREITSYTGLWLLATWLIAAALGGLITVIAVRESRLAGRLLKRLRRESIQDRLTGLPNGVYLEEWLTRSLPRATRHGGMVGLIYVDINNFKQVNHALGRDEGDKLLIEVAEKLSSITRSSDFVARIRNDSFAVVMQDVRDAQQVESATRRFGALGVTRAGMPIRITAGHAIFPEDAETASNLIRLSRAAMYRNRQTRRVAA